MLGVAVKHAEITAVVVRVILVLPLCVPQCDILPEADTLGEGLCIELREAVRVTSGLRVEEGLRLGDADVEGVLGSL